MPRLAHPMQPLWATTRQMCYMALMIAVLATCLTAYSELAYAIDLETSSNQAGLIQFEHDSSVEAASFTGAPNGHGTGSNRTLNQALNSQPTNRIFGPYLKAGPTFVLGKDLLAHRLDAGYSIAGGVRQFLGPGLGRANAFVDIGGSYLSAFGGQTRLFDGEEFDTTPLVEVSLGPVTDAFSETLTEIRRGGVHCGLGWYWGDAVDHRNADPQVRFSTTLGGRLSHIRGDFNIEQIVFSPVNAGGDEIRRAYSFSKTDTAGGLYVNAQAILLKRNTGHGIMQWTLDGEFAHDWIEFDGYDRGGLGTASVLFGFLLTR